MQNPIFSPLSVGIIIESVFRNIKTKNGTTVITSCAVDLSAFPFDVQICSIKMESWYRDSSEFVLKSNVPGIEKSEYHFVENGEWEISNH
jgi:hypothetical protein